MIESLSNSSEIKEAKDQRPYVVSADVRILLQQWADQNGFKLPEEKFFSGMRSDFGTFMKQVFPGFELVTEEKLSNGLTALVKKCLYPLSLDRVYYPSQLKLDIARQINEDGRDMGLGRRADSALLLSQFRSLKGSGIDEVSIVDDVIFTGNLIARVGETLGRMGMRVKGIYAGIGIQKGIDLLQGQGYQVECVRTYDSVIDEICERDFYPGVPLSGRLVDPNNNVGAPYILPFGNPGKWASIPEKWQESLSRYCIKQTVKLFEEIENKSGRSVQCADLERKVIGLPGDSTRFVGELRKILD